MFNQVEALNCFWNRELAGPALSPEWNRKRVECCVSCGVETAGDERQAEAIKLICISQNFNDRRARAAHSDWESLAR